MPIRQIKAVDYDEYIIKKNSITTYHARTPELGAATSEPVFQIKRIVDTGSQVSTRWANDDPGFKHVLDDRDSLFGSVGSTNQLSLLFPGVSEYCTAGNTFNYDIATQWSFCAWIRADNLAEQRAIFAKTTDDLNVYGVGLYLRTNGRFLLQMRTASTLRNYIGDIAINAGEWVFVCFTYNGGSNISGAGLWINGVKDATPANGTLSGSILNSEDFLIGARNGDFNFSGYMDEISVWSKELNAAEVGSLYNGGSPPNPLDATFSASLVSAYTMGDNDFAPQISDIAGTNPLTMVGMDNTDFKAVIP